jgi:hypothetical protein
VDLYDQLPAGGTMIHHHLEYTRLQIGHGRYATFVVQLAHSTYYAVERVSDFRKILELVIFHDGSRGPCPARQP